MEKDKVELTQEVSEEKNLENLVDGKEYKKSTCPIEKYIITPLYKKLGGKYKPKSSHITAGLVNGAIQAAPWYVPSLVVQLINSLAGLPTALLETLCFYELLSLPVYMIWYTKKSWGIYKKNKAAGKYNINQE